MRRLIAIAISVWCLSNSFVFADTALESLRAKFDAAIEKIEAAHAPNVHDANKRYYAALQKIRLTVRQAGDLEALLQVKAEESMVEELKGKAYRPSGETLPEIAKLRRSYTKSLQGLEQAREEKVSALMRHYLRSLKKLKTALVMKEAIESATQVVDEEKRIEQQWAALNKPSRQALPGRSKAMQSSLDTGLLVYFPFDQNVSTKIVSQGDASIYATRHGATWTRSGRRGGGMKFDGKNDYLEVSPFEWGAPLTIATWVRFDAFNAYGRIMDFANGRDQFNVMLGNEKDKADFFFGLINDPRDKLELVFKDFWEADTWTHVAVTIDDENKVSIYKNGQLHPAKTVKSKPATAKRSKQFVGRSNWSTGKYLFDGTLDDFRIYNRTLSPEEVEKLFRFP